MTLSAAGQPNECRPARHHRCAVLQGGAEFFLNGEEHNMCSDLVVLHESGVCVVGGWKDCVSGVVNR